MRVAFVDTLYKLAKKDKRIVLITGDLGFSIFEKFMDELPGQFLNAGIAEQNMTGVAAGMAIEGKIPFIYSIVPFITMRNFEQIRNDVCYQNLNIKIVGVGAGFSYGIYGHTHYGLEDIGILRTLANMTILCPGDPIETDLAVSASMSINGPVYIRLGKAGEPYVYDKKPKFKIGKGIILNDGTDLTIFATSTMLHRGKEVVNKLREKEIYARLVSMHTIKPIDKELILSSARKTKAIFTLEEHSIIGGLGSAVAEVIAESDTKIKFKRLGIPSVFAKKTGSQEFMRKESGLSLTKIISSILKVLSNK
jgi:transketolase